MTNFINSKLDESVSRKVDAGQKQYALDETIAIILHNQTILNEKIDKLIDRNNKQDNRNRNDRLNELSHMI